MASRPLLPAHWPLLGALLLALTAGCGGGSQPQPPPGEKPPATKLAFTTGSIQATAGAPLSPALEVVLQDADGNRAYGSTGAVTLELETNPASAQLEGVLTVNAVDGVARFSELVLKKAGTGYSLRATSGTLAPAISPPFTVVAGSPARLVFSQQPLDGSVRTALVGVRVALQDLHGNTTTASSPAVSLGHTGGNPAAVLSGTLSVAPVNGVATFSDLSLDEEGTSIRLTANTPGLEGATSTAFDIIDDLSPAAPVLAATSVSETSVRVTWTAVGDDGTLGTAASHDLRYASSPITSEAEFAAATPFALAAPKAAGASEAAVVTGLTPGLDYHFALKVIDGAGNSSRSASVQVGADPCLGVTCTPPAASCSADGTSRVTYTSACVVSGGTGVCQDTPTSMRCQSFETCGSGSCVPVTADSQAGTVIISEFSALSSEFIELHNTTAVDVDVHGFTFMNAAGQLADIRAPSDPNGTAGTPVLVPAGGFLHGVANPAGAIPAGVGFVYGAPGATFALADTGDAVALYAAPPAGTLQDAVDFRAFITDPGTPLTATSYVGFSGSSTQLDPTNLTAVDNDTATRWCVSFYPSAERGARITHTASAANGSCMVAVINEVLLDAPNADDTRSFVEIAAPGGAIIGGATLTDVEGFGASAGNYNPVGAFTLPAGTRIPADGILLVADTDEAGNTTVPHFVVGVDVKAPNLDFENGGGDAIQLISADTPALLLDAVGHEAAGAALTTNTAIPNGLAMYEAETALYPPTGASLMRSPASADTGNNRNDFRPDPTPTPGLPNDPVNFTVTGLTPDDGPATVGAINISVTGTDFAIGLRATFGATPPASCTVSSSTTATCSALGNAGDAVARVDLLFSNPTSMGTPDVLLPNGFTYTAKENETNSALEADLCSLLSPSSFSVTSNQLAPQLVGRLLEAGVTEAPGAAAGVLAEVGYGNLGSNPTTSPTWRFFPASYQSQQGNEDEFAGTFVAPSVAATTDYALAFRFSFDGGLRWTYCDLNGAGSQAGADFEPTQLGTMTVTP
ncbi:MAG: hypothetical protein JXB05_34010 [Myxococcaceae bacterium]|nr:hypothetical protein [Myxococcaceae bacterium]